MGFLGGLGWLVDWFIFLQSDNIYLEKKENIRNEKHPASVPLVLLGQFRCSAGWSLVPLTEGWQRLTVPLEMVVSEIFYCSKKGGVLWQKCWSCGGKEGLALGTSTPVTACRNHSSDVFLGVGVGLHSGVKKPFSSFSVCIYKP